MGQLSLMLVAAAFLTCGFLVYRANNTAHAAEGRVWEHQYNGLARDAASTGMSGAVRQLTQALTTVPNTPWTEGALTQTNVAHNGGTYSVSDSLNQCSILTTARRTNLLAGYTGATLMEVRSRGNYAGTIGANAQHSHQLISCYIQADYGKFKPPAFQYAFISNNSFTFNGGPDIKSISGDGNVHSNDRMDLGPQVVIAGHATYSDAGGVNKSTKVSSYGYGPEVPMNPFDPETFRTANGLPTGTTSATTSAYRYDGASVTIGGNSQVTIGYNPMPADMGASKPYIWFVNGDLTINADVKLPGYTIIMTKGKVTFSGTSNVTVTGTSPPNNASDTQLKAWVNSQLINGHPPLGWYANGSVTINGTPNVVGNFYTNSSFTLDGGGNGGNLVGSIAALGTITANGGGSGNNFWFTKVGDQVMIPGIMLPGKQIVRLAFAEWTDLVLDNTP